GVDAVEHGVHQRSALAVDRQHAGADGAEPGGADAGWGDTALRDEFSGDPRDVRPPVLDRPMFGKARLGDDHLVRPRRGGDDPYGAVGQDALRFEGADVDSEKMLHGMKSSRSRLKSSSMREMPAIKSLASPTRSATSQTSSEEWL